MRIMCPSLVLLMLAYIFGDMATATTTIELQGTGSSLPVSLYLNAFFAYRFVAPSVKMTFATSTLQSTLCRLENYTTECPAADTAQPHHLDWGSMSAPISLDAYVRYPDLQLYPTVAGAVVPIYNLNGVTDLVLSLETLAKIWSGRITTWDHPDIVALNPEFNSWKIPSNQPITLVARGDSSSITQLFRTALAAADDVFAAQVGTSSAVAWNGTQPLLAMGVQLVISTVMWHPYALSYSPVGDALTSQVPYAALNRSDVVVTASSESVDYALLELGADFGNNGDAAAHLTAGLCNAVNPLAWPIVGYSYLAVRTATLRPGATCATVAALSNFWLWFWDSDEVETLATSLGFSVLPTVVKNKVVARFQADMQCGGADVYQATPVPVVEGYGPSTTTSVFNKFKQAYGLANSSVALNYSALPDGQDLSPYLQAGGVVMSTAPLPASANAVTLLLAAEAVVGISRYVLTLDGVTLAKVLNGDITTWLHPDIVALNPSGIRDSVTGQLVNDTALRIVLLQGRTSGSTPVTTLLQTYYPAYNGVAIQAAPRYTQSETLWSAVLGKPASFSVTSFVGQLPADLQLTSIVARSGVAVAPSLATAQACAENATYDPNTSIVTLALDNRSCYPLLLPLYVSAQCQCPTPSSSTARTVTFLKWMFSANTLDAALDSLNLVALNGVSPQIQAHNDDALFQLSCGVKATPTDLLPILLGVIIPVVAVVLLGAGGCGWWLWRVTEYNRMMRKKFSNDNVAESCAEAIARFDLASVEWLKEVKEPNKIQLAFLAIIALLTDVKPYIPDQLLSRLTASKANAGEAEDDTELAHSAMSDSHARSAVNKESYRRDRRLSLHSSQSGSPTSGKKAGVRKGRRSFASTDGSRPPAVAMKDWARKRCTYMCVRFGSTHPNPDRRLPGLVQVAGQIVDVAKAHGATIDAVGVDFVAVHWGVTTASGASSARAVHAGLEMGQLRDTLPEEQRKGLWLQMGIGKGLCDCGTVSSQTGHRFFVVWGPEATLALETAMTALPKRVLASLLVSPAVYQEVQFTVQCMPRLYHGDLLLWEPRCVLKKEDDDEWMYELKKMNDEAAAFHQTLLDAFVLAKDPATTLDDLSVHIDQLRVSHSATLSPQDHAVQADFRGRLLRCKPGRELVRFSTQANCHRLGCCDALNQSSTQPCHDRQVHLSTVPVLSKSVSPAASARPRSPTTLALFAGSYAPPAAIRDTICRTPNPVLCPS